MCSCVARADADEHLEEVDLGHDRSVRHRDDHLLALSSPLVDDLLLPPAIPPSCAPLTENSIVMPRQCAARRARFALSDVITSSKARLGQHRSWSNERSIAACSCRGMQLLAIGRSRAVIIKAETAMRQGSGR